MALRLLKGALVFVLPLATNEATLRMSLISTFPTSVVISKSTILTFELYWSVVKLIFGNEQQFPSKQQKTIYEVILVSPELPESIGDNILWHVCSSAWKPIFAIHYIVFWIRLQTKLRLYNHLFLRGYT